MLDSALQNAESPGGQAGAPDETRENGKYKVTVPDGRAEIKDLEADREAVRQEIFPSNAEVIQDSAQAVEGEFEEVTEGLPGAFMVDGDAHAPQPLRVDLEDIPAIGGEDEAAAGVDDKIPGGVVVPQVESSANEQMAAALRYVVQGWPVFPCAPRDSYHGRGGKQPLTPRGFYDATTDLAQIEEWWTTYPEAAIGLRTGPASDCFVLDVDLPDGPGSLVTLEAEHGELPPTREQRTGSGGRQLFFAYPKDRMIRNSAGKLGKGLDVRGDGGYVILPPSGHPSGGTYAWTDGQMILPAPDWLIDLVAKQSGKADPAPDHVSPSATPSYGQAALAAEVAKVTQAHHGQRNDTLNQSAFSLGRLIGGGELERGEVEQALLDAALSIGLTEHEALKTITSGFNAGEQEPRTAPGKAEDSPLQSPVPRGFIIKQDGVHFLAEDNKSNITEEWVCSPLEVRAMTRDSRGEEWGRLLAVLDSDGGEHLWPMPMSMMAGSGDDYRRELLSRGLRIASGRGKGRLHDFLSMAQPIGRARCVGRIGWHGRQFVLPDAVFGEQDDEQILLQGASDENPFQVAGTLIEWQEHIGRLCIGNSRLALAVSAALAAPLLHMANVESGGFHFPGGSSLGKTTTLHVAGSVCGGGGIKGYIRQWRATDNGLESVAAGFCDCLLCLDEMSQVDGRVAGEIAYMLANGQGKSRARRDGGSRLPAEWRVLFLSTGEISLADKVAEDGRKRAKAGQAVRVVDIPADAGVGLGVFEDLHGRADGDRLAQELREATVRFFGSPLRAFLAELATRHDELVPLVVGYIREFVDEHCLDNADGQVKRVCSRFGLVAAAGELATVLGILPWPKNEAIRAAVRCFTAWLEHRGGTGAAEVQAGLGQVQAFFEVHGSSRFETWGVKPEEQKIVNRAGFRRLNDADEWEYYVLPEVFKNEVCRGFDHKMLTRELIRSGMLQPEGERHPAKKLRVPGFGQKRFYHFPAGPQERED